MQKQHKEYEVMLQQLYDRYQEAVVNARTLDDVLEVGVGLQREMEELNVKFHYWDYSKGYDHECMYYVASYIVEHNSLTDIEELDPGDREKRKKLLAAKLFEKVDKSRKKKIHVIEPHPDDMLGSASGLCYCTQALVTLHTICRVIDKRVSVNLAPERLNSYKSIRQIPNIIKHCKYEIDDLHWNNRCTETDIDYTELLQNYIKLFGENNFDGLTDSIKDIVKTVRDEDAYLAFPLGIEHPLHMLITHVVIEQVIKQGFDLEKVIVYVDHPYDYQNVGTGRLQKARDYVQSRLGIELCRCDDVSVDQSALKDVISEIYGQTHYGEFDNSLEKTFCSYFVNIESLNTIKQFLKIHVNNILFITDQAKPFKKTGGLGEVAYVLCKTLLDFVNDVRIIMPKYSGDDFQETGEKGNTIEFKYQGSTEEIGEVPCKILERKYNGLTYYLLDIEGYLGDKQSQDKGNHGKIYAIFCDVILQKVLNCIKYVPSVLHCNDWQTALIPMLKKTKYSYYRPDLKVIYTIHFYGYKGIFKKSRILEYVGLDEKRCRLCITCSDECPFNKIDLLSNEDIDKLNVMPSQMSFMKAGIEFADAVTTVSKGYAREIQQYPDFSNVKVIGIRNGISDQRYQFEKGSGFVDVGENSFTEDKGRNKYALQKKLGLATDFDTPLICMVSRLAVVKGLEVVKSIAQDILSIPAQLVIVGDDDDKITHPYKSFFESLQKDKKNEGKFAYREFSEELEYQTYAGADILLMPSLSEGCGTTQILAMRYGVVPVVSMVEAFNDTVLDYKDMEKKGEGRFLDRGIGFFTYKDDCWVLLEVIKKVVEIYHDEDHSGNWSKIATDCLKVDFRWKNGSVREYLKLYNDLR